MKRTRWLAALLIGLVLTLAFAAAEGMTWKPVSWESITADDVIAVTMTGPSGDTWALTSENGSAGAPPAVEVSVANNRFTTESVGSLGWKRAAADGGWTLTAVQDSGTLFCNNANNGVRVGAGENTVFTVLEDHLYNAGTGRYVGVYVNGTKGQDWRCYTSVNANITGQTVRFWREAAEGEEDDPEQTRSVTVAPSDHGTVEIVNASEAGYAAGTELYLQVTPEDGYRLTSLSWMPEGGTEAIALGVDDLDESGCYLLVMPETAVTVTAVFAEANGWSRLQAAINSCEDGGTVALTEDVLADAMDMALLIPQERELTLDLQGHTIDRGLTSAVNSGSALLVGGRLTITDSKGGGVITGGRNQGSGGGIATLEGAVITLSGGTITGNTAKFGGGVNTTAWADVTVDGCSITGNTAANHGGGVYMESDSFLTLKSGSISGNTAGKNGGGVYAGQYTTFDMTGGSLEGNKAQQSAALRMLESGTFTVTGGTITGNTSAALPSQTVYVVNGSTFTIGGSPRIFGNKGINEGNEVIDCNVFLPGDNTLIVRDPLTEDAKIAVTTAAEPTLEEAVVITKGRDDRTAAACFESDGGYFVTEEKGEIALFAADPGDIYEITVDGKVEHGTVTADRARARTGDTVSLTAAPEYGWRLNALKVTAGDTPVNVENGQFTMPEGNVTVSAAFDNVLTEITYVDGTGAEKTIQAVPLAAGDSDLPGGAYAVTQTLSLGAVRFAGDSMLILGDGAVLKTSDPATALGCTGTLTVFGQHEGTGVLAPTVENGFAVRVSGDYVHEGGQAEVLGAASGICATGCIRIHGGTLNVTAGSRGLEARDSIEITGGTVTAHADDEIGNGIYAKKNMTITGGIVKGTHNPEIAAEHGTTCGMRADLGTLTLSCADPEAPFRVTATSFGNSVVVTKGLLAQKEGAALYVPGSETPVADLTVLEGMTLAPVQYQEPDFVLPEGTLTVLESAFEGTAPAAVYIPDGCLRVEAYAFRNCKDLKQVRIPAGCSVGENAFEGCGLVLVYGPAGSAAETYCAGQANCVFIAE